MIVEDVPPMHAANPALAMAHATDKHNEQVDPREFDLLTPYFSLAASLCCRNSASAFEQHAHGLISLV